MKIKQKKQMNLPQLIEWAWDNDVRNKIFESEGGYSAYFDYEGCLTLTKEFQPQDFFAVKEEIEITEDTVIPKLVHYSVFGFKTTKNKTSINDVKDENSVAFYIMANNRTMTLIWTHEKGMVD